MIALLAWFDMSTCAHFSMQHALQVVLFVRRGLNLSSITISKINRMSFIDKPKNGPFHTGKHPSQRALVETLYDVDILCMYMDVCILYICLL